MIRIISLPPAFFYCACVQVLAMLDQGSRARFFFFFLYVIPKGRCSETMNTIERAGWSCWLYSICQVFVLVPIWSHASMHGLGGLIVLVWLQRAYYVCI